MASQLNLLNVAVSALCIAVIGCAAASAHYTIASEDRNAAPPVSYQMLLISDTHAANPLAAHELSTNTPGADEFSDGAMRPPQMEVWGTRILSWILERPERPRLTVHLGDANNIACAGEFSRFVAAMRRGVDRDHWFMAPGNHDTLVMGNIAYIAAASPEPSSHVLPNAWNRECAGIEPKDGMDKDQFFDAYLKAHDWQVPKFTSVTSWLRCGDVHTGTDTLVRYCKGDEDKPYYWFLIQRVTIDEHTVLIILDTTQYSWVPSGRRGLWHPGGVLGGISSQQIEALQNWVEPGKTLVLAGHFPIDSLDDGSKARLWKFIHENRVATYLSGHIHAPTNARRQPAGGEDFLELNIASVMGWPMEYAYLNVTTTNEHVRVDVNVGGVAVELSGECPIAWRENDESDTFYTRYKLNAGRHWYLLRHIWINHYSALRDEMFLRLASHVGSLPANYAARELMNGEDPQSIIGVDNRALVSEIGRFERCQAIWASKAEHDEPVSRWMRSVPVLSELRAHFDDPSPLNSTDLRPANAPSSHWMWMLSGGK